MPRRTTKASRPRRATASTRTAYAAGNRLAEEILRDRRAALRRRAKAIRSRSVRMLDIGAPAVAKKFVDAAGPAGIATLVAEGDSWFTLPGVTNFWGVAFGSPKTGWLVGTGGRILRIDF